MDGEGSVSDLKLYPSPLAVVIESVLSCVQRRCQYIYIVLDLLVLCVTFPKRQSPSSVAPARGQHYVFVTTHHN